jgi:hypothetical protein
MLANKTRTLLHGVVMLALWAYPATQTHATIVHSLDIAALVETSDLILVGRVTSIDNRGTVTIDMPAGPALAKSFWANLEADQALKGNPESRNVYFEFFIPEAPSAYRAILQGQYGIFFLRRTADSKFGVCDPSYPVLPAVPTSQSSEGSVLDRVTTILRQVLESNDATDQEKLSALDALSILRTKFATVMLQQVLKNSSGDLQLRTASKLLVRDDISGLDLVEAALRNPTRLPDTLFLDLAGSLAGLRDPKSIPALNRLLQTNDQNVIKGAAIALRQSGSADALQPLSRLLTNSDERVRYYAVVGMGEITRQDEWTPAFDEFRNHEAKYLSYWRNWAASNLPRVDHP